MKKTFILTILITVFIVSCNKKQDENTYSISEEHEYEVQNDVVFDADSLNIFYDIAIIDSFVVVTDLISDTVVRLYKKLDFSKCLFKGLHGNGPNDFLTPLFINKAVYYDNMIFFDINSRRIKKMIIKNNSLNFESEFLPNKFPLPDRFCMTENYIIGSDISDRKVFIFNNNTQQFIKIDYFPHAGREYDKDHLMELYYCELAMNEKTLSICGAMNHLNSINFYNLDGEREKTIIIGDRLYFPKQIADNVDFSNENDCFISVCGTFEYVYCLYRGARYNDEIPDVKIFIFNWKGEHITTIQTAGNIFRITADKNNKYLLGLSSRENGSTDIVKIPLEGMI